MSLTYLVTGASRGIGLEFVKQLASAGNTVIATARNIEGSAGLKALKAVEFVSKVAPNGIDVLINNAGATGDMSLDVLNCTPQDYRNAFEINVIGTSSVTQAMLPLLRLGKTRKIVNLCSLLGSIEKTDNGNACGFGMSYAVSKAAEGMLTKGFSCALKEEDFIVVAVHPGWVVTDMGGKDGQLTTTQSVEGMLSCVFKLTTKENGTFFDYSGASLPW
ncbi:4-dihydrotrisporin dehydrogenase [Phycomyces nitens]|nr:4-dihydrotrisporin dehydrogenase [Phycomyces nitens]